MNKIPNLSTVEYPTLNVGFNKKFQVIAQKNDGTLKILYEYDYPVVMNNTAIIRKYNPATDKSIKAWNLLDLKDYDENARKTSPDIFIIEGEPYFRFISANDNIDYFRATSTGIEMSSNYYYPDINKSFFPLKYSYPLRLKSGNNDIVIDKYSGPVTKVLSTILPAKLVNGNEKGLNILVGILAIGLGILVYRKLRSG